MKGELRFHVPGGVPAATELLIAMLFLHCFIPLVLFEERKEAGAVSRISAAEASQGLNRYLRIKKLSWYWRCGPSYSRYAYRRDLRDFLTESIGAQLETDFSFTFESPGDPAEKRMKCHTLDCRWINFHGPVDAGALEEMVKNDPALVKKWWRSGALFSLSGKVKKYRFSRDVRGKTLEIYLDKIVVKPSK